jgi:hypothetical protein
MESWLLMQTFYHGLINSARETMDAAAGGAFLSLTIPQATALVEKMASNQGWNEERTQTRKRGGGMHQLKEVDMLSAKLDLLMKKLDDRAGEKKEVMHVYDSHMTCEECGGTGHSGNHCPELLEDVNYINNNNNYYNRPQQNQGWNQQRPNYSGNYQGNNSFNNNNNYPPLRELVSNQGKLMDNLSKKLASNDKILENINNRMDNFSTAIKNQISFNKMIESQLNQIAAAVPATNPGIPSQPEGLESANLVDMFDAGDYWSNPIVEVSTDRLPVKRGDPGRPVIPISIGMRDFPEALCDFGSSVNIMPRVLYEKLFSQPLLETTMCLQLADRTLSFPRGILKNICVRVGSSYAPADFVVIETGSDERAPVILGRPFLNTAGAVIYASAAKISFYIKGRKETFSFKNKTAQIPEQPQYEPRKRTNRRNKSKKQVWTETAKMVTAVHKGQDRQLKSPFLPKKDDPGMPSIYCSINGSHFYKTLCDTGSGVNIMAKVTYELLFGTMPLNPTYIQLQMADQTFRQVEGTVTDVPVKIDDHFVHTDFQVIDMGEDEYDPPIILGRPFLSTVKAIIYIGTGEVHMHFPSEKVRLYFTDPNYVFEESKQVRTRRRRRNHNQKQQVIKDGWADYEGEVVRSEDIPLNQHCPEETEAPRQVWKEKTVAHEEEALPEPPTTPSTKSQDD